jgi:phosphoribosyl 1,2-cyclic phosphodiesterase
MLRQLMDADALIVEANYSPQMLAEGPYPAFLKRRIAGEKGHLSNPLSAELLRRLSGEHTRHVVLAHLSEVNNSPAVALREIREAWEKAGFAAPFSLHVAPRYTAGPLLEI